MGALVFWTLLWSILISTPVAISAGVTCAIHAVLARTNGSKSGFIHASHLILRFAGFAAAASIAGMLLLYVLAEMSIVKVEAF